VQDEQHHRYEQDDVDRGHGNVKRKESEQPQDHQNAGNDREHASSPTTPAERPGGRHLAGLYREIVGVEGTDLMASAATWLFMPFWAASIDLGPMAQDQRRLQQREG
jgi:hypothetical protein